MTKKGKQKTPNEKASEAQERVRSLQRVSSTSRRRPAGETEGAGFQFVPRDAASSSAGAAPELGNWDTGEETSDGLRTAIHQALLDRDTALISEDISGRFEKCREQMRDLIGKSKRSYIAVGLTVLVAVVLGVLAIVATFISPRLEKLEDKSDILSSSLVRIETILESERESEGGTSEAGQTELPSEASDKSEAGAN